MSEEGIAIPDLANLMLPAATTHCAELGLGIHVIPDAGGDVGNNESRVESNGPSDPPGSVVNPGHSVGVVLYPVEPRQ